MSRIHLDGQLILVVFLAVEYFVFPEIKVYDRKIVVFELLIIISEFVTGVLLLN